MPVVPSDAEPQYSASSAELLYRAAEQVVDRTPGEQTRAVLEGREVAVGEGLFNRNVAVLDLANGLTVNVRMPEPLASREPISWRTGLLETEIHDAQRRAGLVNRPRTYYADPSGRFQIQRHEPDVTAWMPDGVSAHQVAELADSSAATLELDLPHRTGMLPMDMISMQATRLPLSRVSTQIPHDFASYRDLQLAQMESALGWHMERWGPALARLGMTMSAHEYTTRAQRTLDAVVPVRLAPTHPDRHRGNLGMRNGRIFEWDPELIGFHDPRHGVAAAVGWEDYRGQEVSIIEAHRKAAPTFLARGFTEGVEAWGRYEKADLAARHLPRAFDQLARSESVQKLEQALPLWAPFLANIANDAAPHVGITKEVSPELMAGVLKGALRPLVAARAAVRTSTVGLAPASTVRNPARIKGNKAADHSPLSMDSLAAPILRRMRPAQGSLPQLDLGLSEVKER